MPHSSNHWSTTSNNFKHKVKGKGTDIAVDGGTTLLREITYHKGSHSVTCHPAAVTFLLLPQPKLVLNLATLEGCKAELTWWSLYPKTVYLQKTVTYLTRRLAWKLYNRDMYCHKDDINVICELLAVRHGDLELDLFSNSILDGFIEFLCTN